MEKLYLFGTDIDKNIGEGESCWVMMNKIHEEADGAGPALVQAETGERRRKTTTRQLYFLTFTAITWRVREYVAMFLGFP